ncbi:polysaccharide deacetylase family protein [Candidatus Woesearchaeota archaeon]|nr:polysaccharide deacetylase family protein [Candidatus Woesearchaeota archaeon]
MAAKVSQLATIQVDLDGLWTNLQYYGHDAPVSPDIVFTSGLRRYLDLFEELGIKATFFVIGKDVGIPEKKVLLQEAHEKGHELANHTFTHPFGFRKLSASQQQAEIEQGERAIGSITGKKPRGFKAPGYDVDTKILSLLAEKGYLYDSSVIPTPAYPLLMKINSILTRSVSRNHGPRWSWGMAPNAPYHPSSKKVWRKGNNPLLELPCTTFPVLRIPIHATFAVKLGYPFFRGALEVVKKRAIPLNYEFHAADLSDTIIDSRLGHLQGIPIEKRMALVRKMLAAISTNYELRTSIELAQEFITHGH